MITEPMKAEWQITDFTSYSPLVLDVLGNPVLQLHHLATCPVCGFISQTRQPLFCERCGTYMTNGKYYDNEGNEVDENNQTRCPTDN